MKKATEQNATMKTVARLTKLMDTQFTLPGTNFRFGLDGIIGLVPGVGDVSTFAVSCYLITLMARNGASGYVIARMVLNVLIDTLIGSIPLIGDVFDFAFKSNSRNLRLMQEHYIEGRHRGGAWKVVIPIVVILLLIMTAGIWLAWKAVSYLF
jgi:hypothetical protein